MEEIVENYFDNLYRDLYYKGALTSDSMLVHMMLKKVIWLSGEGSLFIDVSTVFPAFGMFFEVNERDIIEIYNYFLIDEKFCDIVWYAKKFEILPIDYYLKQIEEIGKFNLDHLK